MNSSVPILPVRFEYKNVRNIKGWDQKRFPRLFSNFDVYFEKPITIDQSNFDKAIADIKLGMSE